MAGSKETLADLYDCPGTYTRMVGQNTFTIRNACLSILAASQTGCFLEKLKAGDVRGGFLARFAYWPAFTKPRFIAIPPAPDTAIGSRLGRGLKAMRTVEGPADLAPGVQDFYADWLERHEGQLGDGDQAADLSAFWSRLSIMTLKYALLLQVSRDQSLTITSDTMGKAISLTEHLKGSLRRLFATEFAFSREMRNRQKLLRLIGKRPGIRGRDLLRASSMLKRDLMPVVETVTAEGSVAGNFKDGFTLVQQQEDVA